MQSDKILRTFAHALRDCARETDVIGRLDGDECEAIPSHTSNDVAEYMVNHLKHKLNNCYRQLDITHDITFSHGVIAYSPE